MSLFEKISSDIKAAMKSGDKARLEVLRFIFASLQAAQKEKALKAPGAALDDEEVVAMLQKEVKRRKDAIGLFKQGRRDDLVPKEEADLVVISEYLPKEFSRAEIEKIIDGLKAGGMSDFNVLMKETMKLVKGRADGKIVGEVIKSKIG